MASRRVKRSSSASHASAPHTDPSSLSALQDTASTSHNDSVHPRRVLLQFWDPVAPRRTQGEGSCECVESIELTRWTRILFKYGQNLPSQATSEIPGVSFRDVLFRTYQIRHAAVHRRPTSVCEIEEMIGNAISLTTILKDALRTRRMELIRKGSGSDFRRAETSIK